VSTAVCTIVTNRELSHARVLMDSVRAFHPEWARIVLLADRPAGAFDPAAERFQVIEIRHLPVPDKQATLFYYGPPDYEAALKPWLFRWLFDTRGVDRAVFLDARCWVLSELSSLVDALDAGAPVVLTPHLVGSAQHERLPAETEVLRWGVHDGAVFAMARGSDVSRDLLAWWQDRAYRHVLRGPDQGLFGDQRWFDLAAARWPLFTLRDPGYDVAHWNLAERAVTRAGSRYLAAGRPLAVWQFEGFDPERPERLAASEAQPGTELPPAVRDLAADYAGALFDAGYPSCKSFPFAFGAFAGGEPVSDIARSLYRTSRAVRDECGDDPFAAGPGPFNAPHGAAAHVTRLMGEIWRVRPDLQRAFPDLVGKDSRRFAEWFVESAGREYGIGAGHTDVVRAALSGAEWAEPSAPEPPPAAPPAAATDGGDNKALHGLARKLRALAKNTTSSRPPPAPGLNICGYVTADLGVGQSARGAAVAAEAAGIEHVLVDFAVGTMSPKTDRTFSHKFAPNNDHAFNLVHVNADQFPVFRRTMGPDFFAGKYTIAYWHWELEEFPDRWQASFEGVDEVWTPTRFVQGAVSAKAKVPVLIMPHAISLPPVKPSRERFGLPRAGFLFLTMYDLLSYQERKNPEAAIRAFRKAFGSSGDATLVIKVLNADRRPEDLGRLRESLSDLASVVLLTSTLPRQAVYDLEATCDAFVSLHRSEGFGLGLAESMYLGKPVIATEWSGNTDFMTSRNSCPVDYELVTLDRDHGPYEKGQRWAEADVDQAAWYMRALVNDPVYVERIGRGARSTMLTDYSPTAIGKRYRARLELLSPSLPRLAPLISVVAR
jgi:glycosyltransferase involved in cell wall biosynthesis